MAVVTEMGGNLVSFDLTGILVQCLSMTSPRFFLYECFSGSECYSLPFFRGYVCGVDHFDGFLCQVDA